MDRAPRRPRYVAGPDGPGTFLGIASVGFDSDVQVLANRTRLIRGSQVYTYAALRTLAAWRPASFAVSADDGNYRKYNFM